MSVATLHLLTAITGVIVGLAVWLAHWEHRGVAGLRTSAMGVLTFGLGMLAFGLAVRTQWLPLFVAGHAITALGLLSLGSGARLFRGGVAISPRWIALWIVLIVVSTGTVGHESVGGSKMREVLGNVVGAMILTVIAFFLVRPGPRRLRTGTMLGAMSAIEAAFNGMRAIHFLRSSSSPLPTDPLEIAFVAQSIVVVLGIGVAVVLMTAEALQSELRAQAALDPLTHLFNRRSFYKAAAVHFAQAESCGAPISVLQVDVDHFKRVNDTHGHAVGDRVLQVFAESATELLRKNDTIARFGGDEFVVLLPDAGLHDAAQIAKRLASVFHANVSARAQSPNEDRAQDSDPITLSIGVAERTPSLGDLDVDTLIRRADAAMYRAKAAGGNRVFVDPVDRARSVIERGV